MQRTDKAYTGDVMAEVFGNTIYVYSYVLDLDEETYL